MDDDKSRGRSDPVDWTKVAASLARAFCVALVPQLDKLRESGRSHLALRVTIDVDNVSNEISNQKQTILNISYFKIAITWSWVLLYAFYHFAGHGLSQC